MIGVQRYVRHVAFLSDLYRSVFLPFRVRGGRIIRTHLVPRGSTVLDIGANTGRFTAFVAPLVGRNGRVYSFEPLPMASRVLRWVIRLRRFSQVHVIESALGMDEGRAQMTIPLRDGWRPLAPIAHLGGDPTSRGRLETVRLETLDGSCERVGIERVDFIKCDTEGYEFFVFAGARNVLGRDRPNIFCEVEHPYVERQGLEPSQLFDLLAGLGYESYLPTEDKRLLKVAGYAGRANYFFLHPSRMTESLRDLVTDS